MLPCLTKNLKSVQTFHDIIVTKNFFRPPADGSAVNLTFWDWPLIGHSHEITPEPEPIAKPSVGGRQK